jgi:hypothetical protein
MIRPIPLAAAAMLLLAGCSANEAAGPLDSIEPPVTDTGEIRGIVLDEGLLPVSGAQVLLVALNRSTITGTTGSFFFDEVPVGEQILAVTVPGYETVSIRVAVSIDETSQVDVTLKRAATEAAYHVVQIGRGLFGCGATYRQGIMTPNGAFFGIAGCTAGASVGLDDFIWDSKLSDSITVWRGASFETLWKSTQAFGNGMVQDWAVLGCDNNRNATFTRDAGPTPLKSTLNAFQLDYRMADMTANAKCGSGSNAFNAKDRCNETECKIQNRMFSWPSTFGEESQVDVGVTVQQPFTTYLSEFYRAEPPPGYSALPDA